MGRVVSASQIALSLASIETAEIARKRSFCDALELCAEAAGYSLDKQCCADIGMDKARWSRIKSGQEGIKWAQLVHFMDQCGNDVPLLWMLHQRGYDIRSIHKLETEVERKLREAEAALRTERERREMLEQTLRRVFVGAQS